MSCAILDARELRTFHEAFYAENQPVVIRGLRELSHARIFEWSAAYFEPVLGDAKVPVLTTDTGFLSYERDVTLMPYRQFVARSFGPGADRGTRYYFKNPTKLLPPGHDDSDRLPEIGQYIARAAMRNLWISAGQITVGLHFDAAENFNFQLRGEKTFDLYPPGIRGYYPMPMFSQTAHISRVFRDGPDLDRERFPRFDERNCTSVRLIAGDVLYLPAYWWHQVTSHGEENVNLNFWWLPSAQKQILHPNQALRGYAQLVLRYLKFGNLQKAPVTKRDS